MRILARRTVVFGDRFAFRTAGAVGSPKRFILGHTVVCAVELHVGNAVITLDTSSLLKSLGNLVVNFSEDGDLSLDDLLLSAHLHFAGDVTDKSVTCRVIENFLPEVPWCVEVLSSDLGQEGNGLAGEVSVSLANVYGSSSELNRVDGAEVGGSRTLVVKGHVTISLEVAELEGGFGSVDRQLLVVGTNSVAVSIWVGEESRLEDGIGRGLNARRHMRWVESNLLNFGEVVDGVLIESQFTDLLQRVLGLWPDMGKIEDIDLILLPRLLGLLGSHGLDLKRPFGEFTSLDSFVQILLCVVRRLGLRLFLSDELDSLLGLKVNLDVLPVTILVDKLKGVTKVAVHVSIAIWDTSITKQNHDLMDRFGVAAKVVPKHGRVISVRQMRCWVSLLGVDKVGKLGWISQEEDRGVVGDQVEVAIISSELDREASGISSAVVGTRLATNGRESDCDWAFLAFCREHVG